MPPGTDPFHRGAAGVCDDRQRVFARVTEALREAPPGSRGLVHSVTLSFSRIGYVYESLIARGRFDAASGVVVWEDVSARGGWGRLDTLFAGAPERAGDSIPPEALAAGLADLHSDRQRRQATEPRMRASNAGGPPTWSSSGT
ncbi:hypothetical protein [Actinomadura sp. HBU206391]|uniref:hypothetical protein n=1 Tax=Actinomadura sp. HBU206391 TaxID=2731692 RepID=UPI00164EF6AC|nr:hypothetical protein [Actinomadura sp. HBU206391]MBC6456314.1 hypothetical protein [Actinomadura sp. HBU206391]